MKNRQQYEKVFRALGDRHRLEILEQLSEKGMNAGEILATMDIVQSTLSHHMKTLCDSGVVQAKKRGKWTYYRIDSEILKETQDYLAKLEAVIRRAETEGAGTEGTGSGRIRTDEINADEIRTDEINADEIRTDEIGSDKIPADEINTDEIRADEINTGEIAADGIAVDGISAGRSGADAAAAGEIGIEENIEPADFEEYESEEPIREEDISYGYDADRLLPEEDEADGTGGENVDEPEVSETIDYSAGLLRRDSADASAGKSQQRRKEKSKGAAKDKNRDKGKEKLKDKARGSEKVKEKSSEKAKEKSKNKGKTKSGKGKKQAR